MDRVAESYEFFDDSDGQIGEASRALVTTWLTGPATPYPYGFQLFAQAIS